MTPSASALAPVDEERLSERAELRSAARRLLSERAGRDALRRVIDDTAGPGSDPELWSTMASLGWAGLLVAEEHGGSGAGFGEAVVILSELGRHLTPSPYLASAVLAATALQTAGSATQRARWLPAIASGELVATVGLGTSRATRLRARRDGDVVVVTGIVDFVPDASTAGLVLLDLGNGTFAAVTPGTAGVSITPRPTVDQTRRLAEISLDDVRVSSDDILDSAAEGAAADAVLIAASVAKTADALGGAERCLEMASEYAKQRIQFDRPIGSFQAVKHMCADMLVSVEGVRVALDDAVVALDHDPDRAPVAAAVAASHACDAYAFVAGASVQVHGGIGFTWEHDCHLFQKRAKLNQALFGDARFHRERLAHLVLPGG